MNGGGGGGGGGGGVTHDERQENSGFLRLWQHREATTFYKPLADMLSS